MSCLIVRSQTPNLGLFDLNTTIPTRFQALPHVLRENRARVARFSIYTLKLTPLTSCSIAWSQTPNLGLLDLNTTLRTRFEALPHVLRKNQARVARFSIYTLKLTPVTSCLIAQSQALNSGLLNVNNTITTCFHALPHVVRTIRAWAVQFLVYTLKSTLLTSCSIPWPRSLTTT